MKEAREVEKDSQKNCEELVCPEVDDYESSTPGVLLSHEIKYYAEKYQMISHFNPDQLKPAGYRLTLGEDYAIGGKPKKLYPEPGKNELKIPPFEVAIISTKETINLPRFIIARWNLRVSLVYEGLLWTGALQVDPGWCGPLYCPIYNLSSEEVTLKLGEPIVLMDFVKTTPFKKGASKEYPRPPERQTLKDYNWRLKSALFTEAAEGISKIEVRINRIETLIGLTLTSIAILFAALSIVVTSRTVSQSISSPPLWFIFWVAISVVLSIVAIIFAIFRIKLGTKKLWHEIVMIVIFIASIVGFVNLIIPVIQKIIHWSSTLRLFR
jgi:deoxycytidine triphosphate deaminase